MARFDFDKALRRKIEQHNALVERKNRRLKDGNGVYDRWEHPVLTAAHAPLFWRYDLDPRDQPLPDGAARASTRSSTRARSSGRARSCLVARVEGYDRKCFFAVAESANGVDGFRFWDHPVVMPETDDPDMNVYDMRLTAHEDGWIYGHLLHRAQGPRGAAGRHLERPSRRPASSRTKDLEKWERLPDLKSPSPQQRNVVLHPEFVDGQYALYTRPQDGFIEAGTGGGIGWALCETMDAGRDRRGDDHRPEGLPHHQGSEERRRARRRSRRAKGWLHLAHGVRNTAAGLRYVLYAFLCDLADPAKVIASGPAATSWRPRARSASATSRTSPSATAR